MDTDKDDPHGRYHEPSNLNFSVLIAIFFARLHVLLLGACSTLSQLEISKKVMSLWAQDCLPPPQSPVWLTTRSPRVSVERLRGSSRKEMER